MYFPVSQSSQLDLLDLALNVSRGQTVQSLEAVFPVSAEYVPGGHVLHPDSDCTPVAEEYVPAEQFVHVVSSSAD